MTTDDDAKRLNVEGEKLRQAGDLAGAEARYRQALALVAPDSFVAAIALDNLGTALDAGGDLHAGITSHRAALEILAKHPDKVLDIAITANNTGLAYRLLGNRPLAMHYFEMAKQYHESVGATDHYLGTLLNIAALDGDDDAC